MNPMPRSSLAGRSTSTQPGPLDLSKPSAADGSCRRSLKLRRAGRQGNPWFSRSRQPRRRTLLHLLPNPRNPGCLGSICTYCCSLLESGRFALTHLRFGSVHRTARQRAAHAGTASNEVAEAERRPCGQPFSSAIDTDRNRRPLSIAPQNSCEASASGHARLRAAARCARHIHSVLVAGCRWQRDECTSHTDRLATPRPVTSSIAARPRRGTPVP